MGKGNRHMKHLKSEKAKVKLKTKKCKQLPKGQNITDTSFKVKKIVIREQLKQKDETEILSKRKLNVKDLLTRLQHHNSTVRQESVRELKEILSAHSMEILSSQFSSLLQGVSMLSLDREKDIRRDSLKVLNLILSPVSTEQLLPFCDILISYLKCAMTHIDAHIKEDSLLFLDVLVQNCSGMLARNSHKVLPIFLDMISKLHSEVRPGRQLTTTLSSKHTSIKWRIKVLERLASLFGSIVNYKKLAKAKESISDTKVISVDSRTKYIPIYNRRNELDCQINFAENDLSHSNSEGGLDAQELVKYINLLMPLMFDSWVEVCPDDKASSYTELVISNEAAALLKSIAEIIQLVIEYIDVLNENSDASIGVWFRNSFEDMFVKNLLSRFPYGKTKIIERTRKRQEDFFETESTEKCLEQNLALCQIYLWFLSLDSSNKIPNETTRNYFSKAAEYLNDTMLHWSTTDSPVLTQLSKVLRTLFLKASKTLHVHCIDVRHVLQTVINVCSSVPRKELQTQLFSIISDIVLDHTLIHLHGESVFKKFVLSLPSLLLRTSIHDNTIQMINRVVLRYKEWIRGDLLAKQEAIIENAKKIDIIGSDDEKRSRLMICNLFYFFDAQIYY